MNEHKLRVLETLKKVQTLTERGMYKEASRAIIDLGKVDEKEENALMSTLTKGHMSFCEEQMKIFLGATTK